jgi:thiol-disulfide isomerase/thioredoxin
MNSKPLDLQRRAMLGSLLALAVGRGGAQAAPALRDHGTAPEFSGIEQWLNSPPLTLAALRGKVVLVDFWTYSCINCQRTLPYVNRWAETYKAQGLVVVGVHTPEYGFERSTSNVQAAMRRQGVKHPVAQDNRYATWQAYGNQYWPAVYLVDATGQIRFKQFGEGRYAETEAAIQTLLAAAAAR